MSVDNTERTNAPATQPAPETIVCRCAECRSDTGR